MSALKHEMILASAGSGKTYALTNRFVQLLALGAKPERIVALTFTRKAAGEFFDEILKKLATAAQSPEAAQALARSIGTPGLGPAEFLRMLRAVVDAMPRLSLGTLDGFFARVVKSFPLELGLSGDFQIMEEASARRERRRVLRRMFAAAGEPDEAQREFIEAFKRATFGVEEKRLAGVLDGFLDAHGDTYLAAPNAGFWGEAARIWPDGSEWLDAARRRDEAAKELKLALPWEMLNEKQRGRLNDFFDALPEWSPGAPLPDPVEYLVGNAFKVWDPLTGGGDAEITLERKKVPLDARARTALVTLVAGIAGAEVARRLEMTRGLFSVLRGYENNYHDLVRRAGRLTFADVLRLLLPGAGARLLSAGEPDEARLLIDWRLDAKFDHWLLDEFQDTSFAQWSVLESLIDEAVQDPEQRRSLFYVGDVKQSIFAWRGGDPRLFREIFEKYNAVAPGTIEEGRLDESYRSGPPVIAMVNRVFGDQQALGLSVPEAAAKVWAAEWRAHVSAKPNLGGWAELRHADSEEARFAETLKILRETDALGRGLDVAVLVRDNQTAAALADYLRREGPLPAMAESDLHVALDNPLTCALLALLRAAAHPGDTLAQQHLNMTPVLALLMEEGAGTAEAQTTRVLAELHEHGFAATLERWLRKLAPLIEGDAFSRERGRMLVDAAMDFDERGSRDVAEFLEFAERFTVRDTEAAGMVRVMTIHKSKGLGFDLVVLPDLEGKTLAARRDGLAVQRAKNRSVEWVLELPAKLFVERDPVLAGHLAAAEADAAYENLCLLYVAMTRAKRAMYVITEPIGGKSTSKNFPRLLRETLGDAWSEGDARWFEELPLVEQKEEAVAQVKRAGLDEATTPRVVRRPARTPSEQKVGVVGGAPLFALEGGRARAVEFGLALHAALAEVQWSETTDAAALTDAWGQRGEAGAEALATWRARGLADVWGKPRGVARAEVWREQSFEVVLDGTWMTGIFDRVVVARDATGRAQWARVYDFKTDWLERGADLGEAAARHAGQLKIYRRVVAMLTGLAPEAVTAEVVFTRVQERVTIAL
jgi:ATP-dependent helicase/nuclease subunit A